MKNIFVVPSRPNLAFLMASVESIGFNGVDTTVFLKNFVVLMYLLIFVDF